MHPMPASDLLPVCPECGYDLRGIDSDRCPECGLPIDREIVSRIPWVHRRKIGRVKAYWRTLWMATFRTAALAEEVRRPVSIRDGQTFRWVTVLLAWLPLGAMAAGFAAQTEVEIARNMVGSQMIYGPSLGGLPGPLGVSVPIIYGLATPGALPAAVLLALVLVTGVGSYLFHPRRMPVQWQDRAVAISYFACGPLALAVVPLLGLALLAAASNGVTISGRRWVLPDPTALPLSMVAVGGAMLIAAGYFLVTLRLLRACRQIGWARATLLALALAAGWVALSVLTLLLVPWVVGYARLMIGTLMM